MWVGGLPKDCRADDVIKAFSVRGTVDNVSIRKSPTDTFAFFDFQPAEFGVDFIEVLDKTTIKDRAVKVNYAHAVENNRKPRSPRLRSRSRSQSRPRPTSTNPGFRDERRRDCVRLQLANLPRDMDWKELKSVAGDYGDILFAKTWTDPLDFGGIGIVDVRDRQTADRIFRSLHGKRVEGCRDRIQIVFVPKRKSPEIKRRL